MFRVDGLVRVNSRNLWPTGYDRGLLACVALNSPANACSFHGRPGYSGKRFPSLCQTVNAFLSRSPL